MANEGKPNPAGVLLRYKAGPAELQTALADVRPRQLRIEVYSEGWTVADVAHHVTDGDALWKACVFAALGPSVPVFSIDWYWSAPQKGWARRWRYADRAIEDSLALFRANRSITCAALATTPRWWAKPLMIRWADGSLESQTILDVVQSQADHALQHIDEIKEALAGAASQGGPSAGRTSRG